jgi:hypothetical protein
VPSHADPALRELAPSILPAEANREFYANGANCQ